MRHKSVIIVLALAGGLVMTALLLLLLPLSAVQAGQSYYGSGVKLDLEAAAAAPVAPGAPISMAITLTNTDGVTRNLIYYSSIPTGTVFNLASPNLTPVTYTLHEFSAADTPAWAQAGEPVRAVWWNGELGAGEAISFTVSLTVTGPGGGPTWDIQWDGYVYDAYTHYPVVSGPLLIDYRLFYVYLPIMTKRYDPTAPTPTPTPVPTPTGQRFTPTLMVSLQSASKFRGSYAEALGGTYDTVGSDVTQSGGTQPIDSYIFSLTGCNLYETYKLYRAALEYDTSTVTSVSSARLYFIDLAAYPGPPAHSTAIYTGVWTPPITGTLTAAQWNGFSATPLATAPGSSVNHYVSVEISPAAINTGGVTRFFFRSLSDSAAPGINSCGGSGGLGGAFKTPFLYIQP